MCRLYPKNVPTPDPLRHSEDSRGIHDPLSLHYGCCDYAQHDGMWRGSVGAPVMPLA